MTEINIKRIVLDINEVPFDISNSITRYWPGASKLIMDSDGQNYIEMSINNMYRLDNNINGINDINTMINNQIRIPLTRELKLNELGA